MLPRTEKELLPGTGVSSMWPAEQEMTRAVVSRSTRHKGKAGGRGESLLTTMDIMLCEENDPNKAKWEMSLR